MKSWSFKKDYPEQFIENKMKKVKFNDCHFNGTYNF